MNPHTLIMLMESWLRLLNRGEVAFVKTNLREGIEALKKEQGLD